MAVEADPARFATEAAPFRADGGPVGALLVHGFTGSPQSLRPWAGELAAAGLSVRLPVLPGHATRWPDLAATGWPDWYAAAERSFVELTTRCRQVFVMGLSMGGTLALKLAETRPGEVAGLVLVNPSLTTRDPRAQLVPLLARFVRSVRPVAGDIKRPGAVELAYDRMPVRAVASLQQLWAAVRRDLERVTAPLLVYRSAVDHVVNPESVRLLLAGVSSREVEERVLADSYHVATLDNDAPEIFAGSLDFVRRHSTS